MDVNVHQNLKPVLRDLPSARVVVVGDVMTDRWVYGAVERISPEAPCMVFKTERVIERPGGAANVSANLAALGIKDDANCLFGQRTTCGIKTRFVAGQHQLFRCDDEEITPISFAEEAAIKQLATASTSIGCLVLSDYGKGVLTPSLCRSLISWARSHSIPVVVDPKGTEWHKYAGATIVTPNRKEHDKAELEDGWFDHILITEGADGMSLWVENVPGEEHVISIPARAREVFDVTGAGDTVVAVLAACLAVGFDLETAARTANVAAGVVVGKRGTATCSLDELEAAL